jgi:hypothetical protein
MRVSDAERSAMADELSKHYADGRLDEAEFNERLGKAMASKTRADLSGLLVDLPRLDAPATPPPSPPARAHGLSRLIGIVLVAFLAISTASALSWHLHFPFVLFVLIGFFVWRRQHRHWHRYHGGHGPGPFHGHGHGHGLSQWQGADQSPGAGPWQSAGQWQGTGPWQGAGPWQGGHPHPQGGAGSPSATEPWNAGQGEPWPTA